MAVGKRPSTLPALIVRQWLSDWNKVDFSETEWRRKPAGHFFVFSMPASDLLSLSAVPRRKTLKRELGEKDLGIQRRHESERSRQIEQFVQYGYPWSRLTPSQRKDVKYRNFRKPGWLPTAIVINVLNSADDRDGAKVTPEDIVKIELDGDTAATIHFPRQWTEDLAWTPTELPPIEIIDGQHRLLAFEDDQALRDFQVPVVAFHGLDISWQAYLFWTINITPKNINPSLAYDLYPLLRTQDWLSAESGHKVYREARSQELVEALWAHPSSPWHNRINMLGEPGFQGVTQAAWVRSLLNSYVKPWEGPNLKFGGLFGSQMNSSSPGPLPWSRSQQAAFLIRLWIHIENSIRNTNTEWTAAIRPHTTSKNHLKSADLAFSGPNSLLNTDQGVRAILQVTNDLCFTNAVNYNFDAWKSDESGELDYSSLNVSDSSITSALASLASTNIDDFLISLSDALSSFDWRTSKAPGLTGEQRTQKLALRGSGGYKELRRILLLHVMAQGNDLGDTAESVFTTLGYER